MSKAELYQKLDFLELELAEAGREYGTKGFTVSEKARGQLWLLVEHEQMTVDQAVQMIRDQAMPWLQKNRPPPPKKIQ